MKKLLSWGTKQDFEDHEMKMFNEWKPRQIPETGIAMFGDHFEVYYRGVKFAESDDIEYCADKLSTLIGLDDTRKKGEANGDASRV